MEGREICFSGRDGGVNAAAKRTHVRTRSHGHIAHRIPSNTINEDHNKAINAIAAGLSREENVNRGMEQQVWEPVHSHLGR